MHTVKVQEISHQTAGFVTAIETLIERRDFRSRGDEAFAGLLLAHMKQGLEEGRISDHEFSGIWHHLPTYVREVFDRLRSGQDRDSTYFREMYVRSTLRENIPDLVEIAFGGPERAVTIVSLAHLLERITGQKWLKDEIESYFMAQDTVLAQVFDEFCFRVYRNGLTDRIDESKKAGMSGQFGTVSLRTFVTAGRIMFTFARKVEGQDHEDSVSFVGEDGEREGVRAGQQSVYCDLGTACGLIREVMDHWPNDVDDQRKIFKDDDEVSLF